MGERRVPMAEDDRIVAADALPRKRTNGLGVHIRYSSLQSVLHPKPDGGSYVSHHETKTQPIRTAAGLSNSPERRKDKK